MTNLEKFWKAIMTIKPNVELTVNGDITSQADFDNNIIASFDFFNGVPENLHIDKEGNINFNKVNIEKIQNIMQKMLI